MSELRYLIEDTGEKISEEKVRKMFMNTELISIVNNAEEYLQGNCDLTAGLDYIKKAKTGEIEELVKILNYDWNIPIREITKEDLVIEHIEDQIRECKEMTNYEEWNTTAEWVSGYIKGLEYALSEIKGE